jgi:hypothetical protein
VDHLDPTHAVVPTPDRGREGPPTGLSRSIVDTGACIRAGADALALVRDFLDQAARRTNDELVALIEEPPAPTGNARADALLGAIAEHLCAVRGVRCPAWTQDPERFLDRMWFVSRVPGCRAIAIAQAPISLKRRGIMWPARSLTRV